MPRHRRSIRFRELLHFRHVLCRRTFFTRDNIELDLIAIIQ
jgi:hypothetical protein